MGQRNECIREALCSPSFLYALIWTKEVWGTAHHTQDGAMCPCTLVLQVAIIFSNVGDHSLLHGRLKIIPCILKLLGECTKDIEQEKVSSISPWNHTNLPLRLRGRKVLSGEFRGWNRESSEITKPNLSFAVMEVEAERWNNSPTLPSLTVVTLGLEAEFSNSQFKVVCATAFHVSASFLTNPLK